MAYEITKNNIELFNKTYGVDISLSKIQSEAKKLNSYNNALRAVFLEAYKKTVMKDLIKNEDDYLFSQNMFLEFNKSITNSLIDETPRRKRVDLSANMGFKTSREAFDMLSETWNEIPSNQVDIVAENYKNGNIRIRDMVAFANTAKFGERNNMIIASYAEALKKVNESRSFLWRVFHPFRNHAEQRDAKLIEASTKKFITDSLYKKACTNAQNKRVNFERLEKETTQNVLENKDVIEEDLEVEFNADNIKFDPDEQLTEEQKKEIIEEYRRDHFRQIEIEKAHRKELEFKAWIANMNNNSLNNEEEKKNISVDNLKEDVYAKNEPNNKIEESKIDAPNIVKNK